MTFAELELISVESIRDNRLLTKERKSGDKLADNL